MATRGSRSRRGSQTINAAWRARERLPRIDLRPEVRIVSGNDRELAWRIIIVIVLLCEHSWYASFNGDPLRMSVTRDESWWASWFPVLCGVLLIPDWWERRKRNYIEHGSCYEPCIPMNNESLLFEIPEKTSRHRRYISIISLNRSGMHKGGEKIEIRKLTRVESGRLLVLLSMGFGRQ